MTRHAYQTDTRLVRDWIKFPELRLIDRFDFLLPAAAGVGMFGFGWLLDRYFPELGTNGWQMLVWGFLISTLSLYHVTYAVNSIAHQVGSRRFETEDHSRNNFILALLTLGEGWHNNHHRYCGSARQGFYWWEIDITYYVLVLLSWFGLVWDLRPVPVKILDEGRGNLRNRSLAEGERS